MKIFALLQSNVALLAVCLLSSIFFTSCGGGGGGGDGGGAKNNDTAPDTLDGLQLFFVDAVPASFQFAKVGGDANAGGETGFSNSILGGGGDGATTTIVNEFGGEELFDLFENMTNITYTYTKTGTNTGRIVINSQTTSNDTGNNDIFAVESALGSDVDFTMNVVFGSSGGFIGEIAIDYVDVPVEADPPTISYVLTSNNSTVSLQLQGGGAVPVGYDEDDAAGVVKVTPPQLYPLKFSDAANPLEMTFTSGITPEIYKTLGVTSDDQGFGFLALDQGVTGLRTTEIVGTLDEPGDPAPDDIITDVGSVPYAWFGADVTGSDTIAELRLDLPTGTEVYRFAFTSIEEGTFTRTTPADGESGTFNFPNADQP